MPPSPARRVATLCLAATASLGATRGCSGDLLADPSFDLWCGEALCGWELEEGEVRKVATWHSADHGALLVGEQVALSQRSEATEADAACIRFRLTADVDPGAQLSLEMDFYDDGSVEVVHPLQSDAFEEVAYTVAAPEVYAGVRFRVRKAGDARAVLGQVRAQAVDPSACPGAPTPVERPLGAECDHGGDCASALCADVPLVSSFGDPATVATCGGCASDADCDAGEVCGLDWGAEDYFGHRACAAPDAGRPLGVACAADGECASGACFAGQCAGCAGDAACPGGACAPHPASPAPPDIAPHTCDPEAGLAPMGADCLVDADCASGDCLLTTDSRICDPDGRPCDTDADCPFTDLGGACVDLGPAGRCR